MTTPDLNLLVALDVLLDEGNVARAARRLHLSPSAMSRTLARLRQTTGDPLLVRAGRGLVPSPRALEIRERVHHLVHEAGVVLQPAEGPDFARLDRTFTLRASDGFVENFGPGLIERVRRDAPGVRLRFMPKLSKDSVGLRDGSVDLEVGVIGEATGPEVRTRVLFKDRFVAVVGPAHAWADGAMSPARYAGGRHVMVSRTGAERGPIDEALAHLGLEREVATFVGGFSAALALARSTDLVATVPQRQTGNLRAGLVTVPLPFPAPEIPVSMLWHPRTDADPAHRWLGGCVREVCGPT